MEARLHLREDETGASASGHLAEDVYGPMSGQVTSVAKQVFRRALLEAGPRLVEAMFLCEISTTSEALSGECQRPDATLHQAFNRMISYIQSRITSFLSFPCVVHAGESLVDGAGEMHGLIKDFNALGSENGAVKLCSWQQLSEAQERVGLSMVGQYYLQLQIECRDICSPGAKESPRAARRTDGG